MHRMAHERPRAAGHALRRVGTSLLVGPTDGFIHPLRAGRGWAVAAPTTIRESSASEQMVVVTQPFAGDPSANQLTVAANDALVVLDHANADWFWVRHSATNAEGFVPAAYVQAQGQGQVTDTDFRSHLERHWAVLSNL